MCGRHHWWDGSLKTVEGSAGGLASVLLSTLWVSRTGFFTIRSWTSMPSLKLLITRFDVWTTALVGRLPEDGGGECRRPNLCPPLHPSSVQSWPPHYPLVDLHAITKTFYFQVQCVGDTTGGAATLRPWRGVPEAWPLSSSPPFFCPELASSVSACGPPCHHQNFLFPGSMCGRHHWWGGSLKTVEGSDGGLAFVLLSTLLLSRVGLFTIRSWTSRPSLKLLINRFYVWAAALVEGLPEDGGGECRRPGLCPFLHPSSL